ncbi:hypothetical protein OCF64_23705 [Bacillus wiedmannii]|uniref:hypothetical protein n=1 Tax=Bacillus wiedmannii TaxID=1890302 RepID=UPI0021CF2620|nr:hypothetical protein [Bacillus wiedmannii]MCU5684772.1 hypothetical protein [Bacillus wiedmannii]
MKLKLCLTLGISFIAFLLCFQNHASAQDITETSKAVIVGDNTKITRPLSLFTYMYGTIGSQTLEDDTEPVDPESTFSNGQPPNWTDKDIEWLKG